MTVNIGYVELGNDEIKARIYYDRTLGVLPDGSIDKTQQTIINGPNGAALEVTNTTGGVAIVRLSGPTGTKLLGTDGTEDVQVPAGGISANANQLRQQLGIRTRADISGFSLSSP